MATPAELVALAQQQVLGLRPFSVIANPNATPTVQGPRDYQQAMVAITTALAAVQTEAAGGGGSSIESLANVGTGAQVLQNVVGTQGRFRTLVGGANIALTQGITEITIAFSGTVLPAQTVSGRLTLSASDPVPVADVVGGTTLYFLPYQGNQVLAWDGTMWVGLTVPVAGVQITNGGLVANTVYDIFIRDAGGGTPELVFQAWASLTARAVALAILDGVYVRGDDDTQRYLGSIRTTAGGAFNDSPAGRWVWNYYNRVLRTNQTQEPVSTSWSQAIAGWAIANSGSANWIHPLLIGVSEDKVTTVARCINFYDTDGAASQERGAIAVSAGGATPDADATIGTTNLNIGGGGTAINTVTIEARYSGFPGIGSRSINGLTSGPGAGNTSNYTSSQVIAGAATAVAQMLTTWKG